MGEDRVAFSEKNGDVLCSRQRHSSVISSCSEDAETESTSTGYPPDDEEKEEELEYGPGIVNKLKTRFLSITLKQNRGTNMRRSCSMENLLDQDRPLRSTMFSPNKFNANDKEAEEHKNPFWGNLKRAKSMDTLLMDLQPEPPPSTPPAENGDTKRELKIVRRRDGGLLRSGPTICDEELPKPDTVKTYKRMFEPAESRRGSYSRRPPVLRASAKSGTLSVSKSNGVSTSAKVNGTVSRNKLCAKQSPIKAQPDSEVILSKNGNSNQPLLNGEDSKPMCNGNYVKAVPLKITDNSLCNGKAEKTVEKKLNALNHSLNNKDIHQQNGGICNGKSINKDLLKSETNEDYVKFDVKKLVNQTYKVVNGSGTPVTKIINGIKTKPKVPPNRPAFIKNVRPGVKVSELNGIEKKNLMPKAKLSPLIASKKISDVVKSEMNNKNEEPNETEPRLNGEVETDHKVSKPSKVKDDGNLIEENNKKNSEKILPEAPKVAPVVPADPAPEKEPEKEVNGHINGDALDTVKPPTTSKPIVLENKEFKSVKKQQQSSAEPITTSMVFDFRGKDVVAHVALLPTPFGCKALHPKKRPLLIDGKEAPSGNGVASEDEDEYHMDYSVPPPSGVIFEGENVKIGKGSILSTRNKELKIKFDDNVDENTFVYPSESSLLEDGEPQQQSFSPTPPTSPTEIIPNGQLPAPSRLKTNPAIGSSGAGGLSTYTPSVLRTVDNFEPGMFRPLPAPPASGKEEQYRASGEEENTEVRREDGLEKDEEAEENSEGEMLKPADPGIISSWSLSAGTSDLLF